MKVKGDEDVWAEGGDCGGAEVFQIWAEWPPDVQSGEKDFCFQEQVGLDELNIDIICLHANNYI